MTYQDILTKISSNTPFAFARYGDGEWLNIRKAPGSNCDGNKYYPELGDRLEQIVSNKQDYILGAQDYKKWNLLSDVEQYDINTWIDADIFHKASMNGKLSNLFKALNEVHVVYIGNESLKSLNFINEFIQIPYNNVWLEYTSVLAKIKATFSKTHKTYLFSAGMCANIFIHDLWSINRNNSYIDVGSVFDPYIGRNTRKYHSNLNIHI